MRRWILNSIFLIFSNLSFCQTFHIQYGGLLIDFDKTIDNGFILTGVGGLGESSESVILVRTDSLGTIIWTKKFDDIDDERGYSVKQTNDSGFIVAGQTSIDGIPYPKTKIILLKTDANGNEVWYKKYNFSYRSTVSTLLNTIDGGFIIGGNLSDSLSTINDNLLIRTDSAGNIIWDIRYGDHGQEQITSIEQTTDSNFLVTTRSQLYNTYLSLISKNGNLLWSKKGIGLTDISAIHRTFDGGFILCGGGCNGMFVCKLDVNGNNTWAKSYLSGTGAYANDIQQTSDSCYITTGTSLQTSSNYFVRLIKLSQNGDTIWTRSYQDWTYNQGVNVKEVNTGYVVQTQYYLIKTDQTGFSGCREFLTSTTVSNCTSNLVSMNFSVSNPFETVSSTVIPDTGMGITSQTDCLDIDNVSMKETNVFSLYPNPFQNAVKFSIPIEGNKIIIVYNSLGIKKFEGPTNQTEGEIDFTFLSKGLYFIKIKTKDGDFVKKTIKE